MRHLILSLALCIVSSITHAATLIPVCSWNNPGQNPYMGDLREAVLMQSDIPVDVLYRLAHRVDRKEYDELVKIKRDSIEGTKATYSSHIWNMNFGSRGRVCMTVDRSKWQDQAFEMAMVFCEGQYCILLPEVCRNISRIMRLPGELARETIPSLPMETFESLASTPTPSAFVAIELGQPDDSSMVASSSFQDVHQTIPKMGFIPTDNYGGKGGHVGVIAAPVPEPSTWIMMLVGLVGLLAWSSRRK